MIIKRHTVSLCPTCYKEIPATITVQSGAGAVMHKACTDHGEVVSVVEPDPLFYSFIQQQGARTIYNGYFVDVTRTCNLRCNPCYYKLEKSDPEGEYSIDAIVTECEVNRHRAPFILTGGEPTMRKDLPELIRRVSAIGPAELITNGIKLSDPELFNTVVPLLERNGASIIHLSIHPETDKWRKVIARCRAEKVRLGSLLIVVKDEEQFQRAADMALEFADVTLVTRIKAASRIWHEQSAPSSLRTEAHNKVYVSDMIRWLEDRGDPVHILTNAANKSVFVNVVWRGTYLMLVAWHDTMNVDLVDIDCPPYYRTRSGEIANMVTAMLLNEGLEKGWCKGRPVARLIQSQLPAEKAA